MHNNPKISAPTSGKIFSISRYASSFFPLSRAKFLDSSGKNYFWEELLLRIGVAFAFLYPPFDALANPDSWIGYFPKFVHGIAPDPVLLHGFGIIEVIIALWILSGKKIFLPSLIAALMLITIVIFNLNNFEILFRDLSIAMMAFSLAISAKHGAE